MSILRVITNMDNNKDVKCQDCKDRKFMDEMDEELKEYPFEDTGVEIQSLNAIDITIACKMLRGMVDRFEIDGDKHTQLNYSAVKSVSAHTEMAGNDSILVTISVQRGDITDFIGGDDD